VSLAATLILPRNRAGKIPVILIRTPYAPAAELSGALISRLLPLLIQDGYAVIVVNERGTQWSQGTYHWLKGANRDGYDILEWITHQSWSNGKVGTFGCSSSAENGPPLSTLNHPAHKALVEMAGSTGVGSVPGYHDQGAIYHGGVPDLSWAAWYLVFGHWYHPQLPLNVTQEERARLAASYSPQPIYNYRYVDAEDFRTYVDHLPSGQILRALDSPGAEWDRLIELTPASPEWRDYDFIRTGDKTTVPGLHIDSWYDTVEAYPTIKLYEYLLRTSPNQHLVMGATSHCAMGTESEHTVVGERPVGDARFDYIALLKGWYDQWLKGIEPRSQLPPVQYYVLNSSRWESSETWPPPNIKPARLYLVSGGHANSLAGDGRLAEKSSSTSEADTIAYDPLHPVPSPTIGGAWSPDAVTDQSTIESRQDVLIYTTDELQETIRVVGDVDVTLSVSTSVLDTDIMVKLVDVFPDGHPYNLTDSALRLRYRDGVDKPALMRPGKPYTVTVHGMITATDLPRGHRLRLEIANSNFPNYERNLNTGGSNYNESTGRVAATYIHHDSRNLSHIDFHTVTQPNFARFRK
jgi:uncharacterized protein